MRFIGLNRHISSSPLGNSEVTKTAVLRNESNRNEQILMGSYCLLVQKVGLGQLTFELIGY